MSHYDKLFASVPLDKTAAVVTGGGAATDDLTLEQRRENLISLINQLERAIKSAPHGERKKWLGRKKLAVQGKLREIHTIEYKERRQRTDISPYIVDVLRPKYTKAQWDRVVREARDLKDAADAADAAETERREAAALVYVVE